MKLAINAAFNFAARYVQGVKKFDHLNTHRNSILGFDLRNFLKARNRIFMFKLIMFKKAEYLYEELKFPKSVRSSSFILPKYNYLNTSRLFFVNAVKLWNSASIFEELFT